MNKDIIEGKWKEIKGDLRKTWGNITDDEWEQTKGDTTAMAGILQKKYGYAREEASEKVSEIMSKYASAGREHLEREERDRDKPLN